MKKNFTLFFVSVLCLSFQVQAEKAEFAYSVGGELTSAYLWRGIYSGGLSLQPTAEISYAGVTLGAWANLGASDWKFNADSYFNPELDIYLSYSIAGFTASITHLHYFDSKYFDFSNNADNTNQTEAALAYDFSEAFENVNLSITWNTQFAGIDGYLSGELKWKRAYSTYIELTYDFTLPAEINLQAIAGFSPWKGLYSEYDGNFAFNNLSVRLEKEFELSDACTLSAFAQPMFNFYDAKNFKYGENFIWAIGMGIWF